MKELDAVTTPRPTTSHAAPGPDRPATDPAPADLPADLYTPEQRRRRDASRWTLVQGILAPLQFLVFLVSLALVIRYLVSGAGAEIATVSVVLKTLVLYAIMITGSLWEKDVFGEYLFVEAFFWEDVFSMLVLALHTAYLVMVAFGWGSTTEQMVVALAAYLAYVINAVQFLVKFRQARRAQPASGATSPLAGAAS